jgi:predicted histone-like DNA-binding protein
MKYRVVKRVNPQDINGKKLKCASPVKAGTFTINDFSKQIAGRSSLTRGDVENVLTNFLDEVPTFLKIGMSVQLAHFGTLRLSISSESVDEDKEFTVAMIRGVHVIFTPSSEFKESLRNITFEEERIKP